MSSFTSWKKAGSNGSGSPTGAAGGDLGGTYPNPTVTSGAHLGAATVPSAALATVAVANGGTGNTVGTALPVLSMSAGITASTTTTQAGATPITTQYTQVTAPATNTHAAVVLPTSPVIGALYVIERINSAGGNLLYIFPQSGAKIDQLATDAAWQLSCTTANPDQSVALIPTSSTTWKIVSPPGGSTSSLAWASTGNITVNAFSALSSGTVTGTFGVTGAATFAASVAFTPGTTLSPSGATQAVSFATGSTQVVDLASASASCAITLTNGVTGGRYVIKFIGNTSKAVTWTTSVLWPGGVAPVITASAGAVDIVELWLIGTQYYGAFKQAFA